MIRNNFWRFVIVILVVLWSLYEAYPPTTGDLIGQFEKKARVVPGDTTISNIVYTARELSTAAPDKAYANLLEAIGTNNITSYFAYDAANQPRPTAYIVNRLYREVAGKIKLGLDLQGGTSFLVKMDLSQLSDTNEVSGALSHAVEVVRKRIDRFGVAEPIIQPAGENRILIQLPGLSEDDRNRALTNIQKTAFLEFRLVHERSAEFVRTGEIPPGHELLRRVERTLQGGQRLDEVVVKRRGEPGLTGSIIRQAVAVRGNLGELEINFQLTPEGAERFGQVTSENVGRQLAIVLDGELYSAPVIRGPIVTGSGSITGNFDVAGARELAGVLENPLRAPLKLLYSNDIDPKLGKESIRSGIKASIYGVVIVSLFMLGYYFLAGLIANIALVLNVIIVVGVMCSIGTTFTLPGIAALVLTLGMAVDANVLIYERIREELAKGKSLRGAVAAGYDRAFSTIFDSNVTTLIASVILIYMGTGSVKGFGVTLTIGVIASMFTALVATRLIFDWLLARELIKSLKMLEFIRNPKFDFMKLAKPAFIVSWLIILVGLGWGFKRGGDAVGVEFTGGDEITLGLAQDKIVEIPQLEEVLNDLGLGTVLIGYQKSLDTGIRTLSLTLKSSDPAGENVDKLVVEKLRNSFPESNFEVLNAHKVGPAIGKELRGTALLAMFWAMLGIMAYVAFRYEFSFAIAAIIATVHDVLITVGVYFIAGRELNGTTIAALLTIIGFSMNDTIVIFDRIREDLKLGVRGSFREVINRAVNETLSRTIITSGTTFLATMSLFIFGGGPVNDFAFTFLIGIIVGVYSSVYIASAVVLWWHKGERPAIGAGQVMVEDASTTTIPAAKA